jgi:hypothetical protein
MCTKLPNIHVCVSVYRCSAAVSAPSTSATRLHQPASSPYIYPFHVLTPIYSIITQQQDRIKLLQTKLEDTEGELASIISGGQAEIRALRARGTADREALKSLRTKMIKDMEEKLRLERENECLRLEVAAWRLGAMS